MCCQVWDVFAFSLSEEQEFRFTLHEFAKFPAFTNFFLPYQAGGDRRAPRERAQPVRAEKSRRKKSENHIKWQLPVTVSTIIWQKKIMSKLWGLCGLHEAPVVLVPPVPSHGGLLKPTLVTARPPLIGSRVWAGSAAGCFSPSIF